eukprot:88082_1
MPGAEEQVGLKHDEIEVRLTHITGVAKSFHLGIVKIDHLREKTYPIYTLSFNNASRILPGKNIAFRVKTLSLSVSDELQELSVEVTGQECDERIQLPDIVLGACSGIASNAKLGDVDEFLQTIRK